MITPNALVAIFSVAAASVALMILLRRRPATPASPRSFSSTVDTQAWQPIVGSATS